MMQKGFTLVELLIVIVVIAILAVIATSTYSSIQVKARNTQTSDAVKQYIKAILLHGHDKGFYPYYNNATSAYPCIGDSYPSHGGNPANRCASISGASACGTGSANISSAFAAMVRPYAGNGTLATPSNQRTITYCGQQVIGGFYTYSAASKVSSITYFLEGDLDCPRLGSGAISQSRTATATRCIITFPTL